MDDTFVCAMCKGEFQKIWSDEEAMTDAVETWGEEAFTEGAFIVCDDCYQIALQEIFCGGTAH